MITLQKNATSTIFETIFCYFYYYPSCIVTTPFLHKIIILHLFSEGIFKQKLITKETR